MPKYVASYEGSDALNSFLINENNEPSPERQFLSTNLVFNEMVSNLSWRNPISREIVNHLLRRVMGRAQLTDADVPARGNEPSNNDNERLNESGNDFGSG